MRNYYITLISVFTIIFFAVNIAYAEEPSKEETFAFMKEKMDKYGGCTSIWADNSKCRYTITKFSLTNEGFIEYSANLICDDGSGGSDAYKIPLEKLDPTTIEFTTSCGETGDVTIYCFKKNNCVKENEKSFKSGSEYESEYNYVRFYIQTDEQQHRFAKALEHLVKLYGGKGEPF